MLRARLARWRDRPRGARIADLLLATVIALVFLAVALNVQPTVRGTKRYRVDLRVAKVYLRAHPELGKYGTPTTQTEDRFDLACAYRAGSSKQGLCMQIDGHSFTSTAIMRVWDCHRPANPPGDPLPGPGAYYCPIIPHSNI